MNPPGSFVTILAAGSMLAYLVSAGRIRGRALATGRQSITRAGGPARWLPFLIFVPYVVMGLRRGPEIDVPTALRWIGVALIVAGPAFSCWSAHTLGRHFDLDVEVHGDHEIIDGGPYGIVRHPVYLGIAIHFIGACLATGDLPLILGTFFVTFPALYVRAAAEEKLLRESLGAAYEAYARRVPMLVPRPLSRVRR